MISRRNFVAECCTVAAAFAAAPAALGFSRSSLRTGRLGYAEFAAQIDTYFRVQHPSGDRVNLRLVRALLLPKRQVLPGRAVPADAHNERFSLIFRGSESRPLAAAIHTFEHDELGRFDMYFGEIGVRDGGGIRYEAVFNQATT